MSNYRRLISYIYAYEGGVKGKNIGYAKIEVRGDQCRIQVNVKKVYVGSNDIGVYLLSPGAEIMLGKIFIRGGAGEFRVSVHSGNVEGSGYSMDQCYGLTVHDVESTWQCYTTIWDDAVTQAAELEEDYAGAAGVAMADGGMKAAVDGGDVRAVGGAGGAENGGDAGDVGNAGVAGVAGGSGNAGVVGNVGNAGVAGDAGAAGNAGGAGNVGNAGVAGNAGDARYGGYARDTGNTKGNGNVRDTGNARGTVNDRNARNARNVRNTVGSGDDSMVDVTEKAAEIELADVTSENVRAKEIPTKIPADSGNGSDLSARFPVSAEIERELSAEEARLANVAPWEQEELVKKEDAIDAWLPEPAEEPLLGSMEKSAKRMMESSAEMRDYIGELADSVVEESMEGLQETMLEDGNQDGSSGLSVADFRMNKPETDTSARQKPDTPISSARMMQEAVQQALQALVGSIMTGPEKPETGAKAKADIRSEAKLEAWTEAKPGAGAEARQEAWTEAKPEVRSEAKLEASEEAKPEVRAEAKPEVWAEAKPEAGAEANPEAWVEANPEASTEVRSEASAEARPEATEVRQKAGAEVRPAEKPEAWAESKPEVRAEVEPEAWTKAKPVVRAEVNPEAWAAAEPAVGAGAESSVRAEGKPEQDAARESGMGRVVGQIKPVTLPPGPGDPAKLEALERMEKEAASQNYLWNQLGRRYPKVLAFDYDYGCEILSIKPQDIGLLPREVWVYGNNSFLLHGYYNYRHLILAKLNNPKGRPRYLLGVPGHYFSNEKYMASMFGFPNFVLAKKQPEADGRYGYWYTDIRM